MKFLDIHILHTFIFKCTIMDKNKQTGRENDIKEVSLNTAPLHKNVNTIFNYLLISTCTIRICNKEKLGTLIFVLDYTYLFSSK